MLQKRMKLIEKVQSFSDIITNSSSEVFVTKGIPDFTTEGEQSGCITIDQITPEWIERNIEWEDEAIEYALDSLGLDGEELVSTYPENKEIIEEALKDCYFIDIEDHYDWDSYEEDISSARCGCLYIDYRH